MYLEYHTVVVLCLFFWFWREKVFGVTYVLSVQSIFCAVVSFCCCGGKVKFVQIPYSHDRFSKIPKTFFVKKLIPYKTYVREDQLFLALYGSTIIQTRNLFLFLINTLLLYPSLSPYSQTERRTDRGTNTLALPGLEEPAHALRGLD